MKGRKHRSTGGTNEAAEDMSTKPEKRNNAAKIFAEADERKSGGRAKRKRGGLVGGDDAPCNAGRKPRKSGGRAGVESNPFSSARKSTPAPGRKVDGGIS